MRRAGEGTASALSPPHARPLLLAARRRRRRAGRRRRSPARARRPARAAAARAAAARDRAAPSQTALPPAPPGWRYQLTAAPLEHPRRWDLFTAGIVTFSGAWTATLMAGIPTFEVYLDIPLVGPL